MVLVLAFLLALLPASSALALEAPSWLPKYDVAINLDVDGHKAHVTQHVTWQTCSGSCESDFRILVVALEK